MPVVNWITGFVNYLTFRTSITTMILFEEDWLKYPSAMVHTSTKNKTFLHFSSLLKSMGVKNCYWPLQLHDPELEHVDPFSPDVLKDMSLMMRIIAELKANPFYYFREIARAPGGTADVPLLFRANRGNMATYWLFFNHITVILIQIRQSGKSFSIDELMTYALNIGCYNTQINALTKDETLRSSNLERLKEIENTLPVYLRMRGAGDIGNTEELSVKKLNNRYRSLLPNKSEKMALNVGRGLTAPIFHIDEFAFLFNIAITLPAALAAGTAARDLARSKDSLYGTILTTTAGKKDDRDGAYAYNLVQDAAEWSEGFYDVTNREALMQVVRKASREGKLSVNCTFNHRQLGYTDEWLRQAISESEAKGEAADRDFGNTWTSGTQSSPLSVDLAALINDSKDSDPYAELSSEYAYCVRWYIPYTDIEKRMKAGRYILSLDTSDAVGQDDIGLVLRDVETGEVVAAGNYNETNLITFSEWIVWWLVKFSTITLIIERRSSGATIIDYLLVMLPSKGLDPFRRIYNTVVQDGDDKREAFEEIARGSHRPQDLLTKYKRCFGFATSAVGATSRDSLYGTTFQNAAKITGAGVKDAKLIHQILSLVVKNGRIDHSTGGHDDMVVAWLLSGWLLFNGKNLDFYGINARQILCRNTQLSTATYSPKESYENDRQMYYRARIDEIVTRLKNEHNLYSSQILEHELRGFYAKLSDTNKRTVAIEQVLTEVKHAKQINLRNRYRG